MILQPYDDLQLEEQLEVYLEPVLSSRRTALTLAIQLASFRREQQELVISWVDIISRSSSELAYQFAHHVPMALNILDEAGIERWVIKAMDEYDQSGLYKSIAVLSQLDQFMRQNAENENKVAIEDVIGILQIFLQGLPGRKLKIEPYKKTYTDTENVFVPENILEFDNKKYNFYLYKAQVVLLWAQNRFGTFSIDVSDFIDKYQDRDRALYHFNMLENIRLDACIKQSLPGIHRMMTQLRTHKNESLIPISWDRKLDYSLQLLSQPHKTVKDSLDLLPQIYHQEIVRQLCYQGDISLEQVARVKDQRIKKEKDDFRFLIYQLSKDILKKNSADEAVPLEDELSEKPVKVELVNNAQSKEAKPIGAGDQCQLMIVDQLVKPPQQVADLISSIIQDFGDIPDDYLQAGGYGRYGPLALFADRQKPQNNSPGRSGLLYNEWDYKRGHYRKNWCTLYELSIEHHTDKFVHDTLKKYSGFIKNLRNTFEVFRGEDKRLKKQPVGDEIDIDAMVDAYADAKHGLEIADNLFTRNHKTERNIAVIFMVDMSGSTDGWVNTTEREALILLCEALETLGDRYAIYGFSGLSRYNCHLFHIKYFSEKYDARVASRIAGIRPKEYTRMGVIIRHLSQEILKIEAKTRLLITLSDGKPDDSDGYRGKYGIEDTRKALIEAKRDGIHPFCITIDKEGEQYLPHMYGAVNYTVIDDVRKLPVRVSDIYRRLTA